MLERKNDDDGDDIVFFSPIGKVDSKTISTLHLTITLPHIVYSVKG